MNEEQIEHAIAYKGLNAPRVTPEHIDSCIKSVQFYIFPDSQLTICCMTLINGFTVTGESACVSPENFDKEVGEEVAKENARSKIWVLEGYALKEAMFSKK